MRNVLKRVLKSVFEFFSKRDKTFIKQCFLLPFKKESRKVFKK